MSKKKTTKESVIENERLYNDIGAEVTNYILFNRTILVTSKKKRIY